MSTSDPVAPDRLEALLRGEAGADAAERRVGALLDELTAGDIAAPAELRERVKALTTAPPEAAAATPRRLRRPRLRLAPVLGVAAVVAVLVGVAATQRNGATPVAERNLKAADSQLEQVYGTKTSPPAQRVAAAPADSGGVVSPSKTSPSTAPLPDGQRAQDYAATLSLAVGSVAELSRSTQTVLDTVRALGGAVVTVDYGTPSAGSGRAAIDLRVP